MLKQSYKSEQFISKNWFLNLTIKLRHFHYLMNESPKKIAFFHPLKKLIYSNYINHLNFLVHKQLYF
jgi:hypothetical protein